MWIAESYFDDDVVISSKVEDYLITRPDRSEETSRNGVIRTKLGKQTSATVSLCKPRRTHLPVMLGNLFPFLCIFLHSLIYKSRFRLGMSVIASSFFVDVFPIQKTKSALLRRGYQTDSPRYKSPGCCSCFLHHPR